MIPHITNPKMYIGTFRKFAGIGPSYIVLDVIETLLDGDHIVKIEIPSTEETVSVRLSSIITDPEEEDI